MTSNHGTEEALLRASQARLDALADLETAVIESSPDGARITGRLGDRPIAVWVKRDLEAASEGDVRFVGAAVADMRRLLRAIRSGERLSGEEIESIEARVREASPAPWIAFIESDGGQGGCDVIRITEQDAQPDMYLWFDSNLAPSDFFRLIAAARQDIPTLLEFVR